jgi:long-chain acyl-CoA synthetase
MNPKHFGAFISGLAVHDERVALTIRPFLKIERTSYKQLRLNSYRMARYLQAAGLVASDRILIIAANSPQWVTLFLGAQLIGATIVSVDARNNLVTTTTFIKQTKPKLIFRGRHVLAELDDEQDTLILEDLAELLANSPATPIKHHLTGEETAVIVFTSGTTAAPKGVVLTQHNVLANVAGVQKALKIQARWRFLSVLPLSHMYELTGGCLVPLASGSSIYYLARVTPLAIARGLREYHITTILTVPQLLGIFLQRIRQTAAAEGQAKALDVAFKIAPKLPFRLRRTLFKKVHQGLGGKLELVVTGSAPIPVEVSKAWENMGVRAVQGYGLTETAPILTVNGITERQLDSQGRVLSNIKLRIGEGNEIQAKGPSVFREYYQNPTATAEAFTEDGWFKTGDIGRIDNGWLRIQGRAKFAIVLSSGLKVFPEDVEIVLDKQEGLTESCVVGRKGTQGEEVVAVIISDKKDAEVEAAISATNAKLEGFQHITDWIRYSETDFPRTRLLKVDRKAIIAWVEQHDQGKAVAAEVHQVAGDKIVEIIRLALDKPRLSAKDTDVLADIGLDSLKRLSVVSLIEEQLNIAVPESHITQHTTVQQLRKLVDTGSPAESSKPRPSWPYKPTVHFWGNLTRNTIIRAGVRFWVKSEVFGSENLHGLKTPAIFIFNHVDGFDGPVLYQSLPLHIRNNLATAVADDVMTGWKNILPPIIRFNFSGFNFARKEPYGPSLEYVASLVDQGWNIAIAPEGHISHTGKLEPFKTGIGLLAVELGIPVVPVKTRGLFRTVPLSKKWPQKHSQISVSIGQPLTFSKHDNYVQVTKQLHDALEEL